MEKKTSYGILMILFLIVVGGCLIQTMGSSEKKSCEKQIFAMDTVMTFQAYGKNAEKAVDAVVEEINRLSGLLSIGEKNSEVSRLNEMGEGEVSKDTFHILKRAVDIYEKTNGAFDCTIYPVMKLWGFSTKEYRVPAKKELEETVKLVDSSKIHIVEDLNEAQQGKSGGIEQEPGNVYVYLGKKQEIDLGGIAKGYASDRAIEIFKQYGIESGMVSLGGNIKTLNGKMDGTEWVIGIRDPKGENSDSIAAVKIKDKAVVTSGGYERYFEESGKTYIHILDPKTGYPAENGILSVTIISEDGMLSDALSTSLYIMGEDAAIDFWKGFSEAFEMILITEDERILVTEGLENIISVKKQYSIIRR